jgi:tetratricopeptide (TPR) repeat protein
MPRTDVKLTKETLSEAKGFLDKGDLKAASELLDPMVLTKADDTASKQLLARALILKAQVQVMTDLPSAKGCAERALALSKETMDRALEAEALCVLGNVTWKLGDFPKSLDHLAKARDIAKSIKDKRIEGIACIEKGTILQYQGDPDGAEREFREAVLLLDGAGDLTQISRAYNNFADLYSAQRKYERAAEMFSKSKKFAEKIGNKLMVAWGAYNLGDCYFQLGKNKEALDEFNIAQPIFEGNRDIRGVVAVNQSFGLARAKMGDWEKAEEHMNVALRFTQKNKAPVDEGKTYVRMAQMYEIRGDMDKAVRNLKKALDIFEKHGADQDKEWAVKMLNAILPP